MSSAYWYNSLYLRGLAIFAWGLARLSLEKADEVQRIFKAEMLTDLRYAESLINKQLSGSRKHSVINHAFCGSTCLCFNQFAEIFSRITAFVCKVGYGRQALMLRFLNNVVIEQRNELLYHRMIYLLTCDELAVVETHTVVQQQLDI